MWEQNIRLELELENFDPLSQVQCLLVDETGEEMDIVGNATLELWELLPD